MEKIELWDEKELTGEDLGEKNYYDKDISRDPLIEDNYIATVDYNARQDSVESLGSKLGINTKDDNDKDKDGPTRRSDRNLDKKDARIEDLAKERATDKDNYGKSPTILDERISLFDMAKNVGVELGCTIDLVNQNLDLIANMEQARRDIYLQNSINKNREEKKDDSPSLIDIGDVELEDLCSGGENSEGDIEIEYYDKLKKIFSSNKKNERWDASLWGWRKIHLEWGKKNEKKMRGMF